MRWRKVSRGEAVRVKIVLRAADGLNNCEIACAVGVTRQTVRARLERFAEPAGRYRGRSRRQFGGRQLFAPRRGGRDDLARSREV